MDRQLKRSPRPRSSLANVAYANLKGAISDHKFPPGTRMREADLARWLGISRTPVRDALGQLQSEGLLEAAPRRGLIVASLSHQQVSDIYAVRDALDGLAATLAARHATAAEIATLRELLARQADTPSDDTATLARLNERFHNLIYVAARNEYLRAALDALRSSLALLPGTTYSSPGRAAEALEQHAALIEAIASREYELAGRLAREHILAAERIRLLMLSDENDALVSLDVPEAITAR